MMETDGLIKLEPQVSEVARTLKVFANAQRIRILCRLVSAAGELPIVALALDLEISQPALSQHLAKLRKSGVIVARRSGHNLFYRIADPRVSELAASLQDFVRSKTKPAAPGSRPFWCDTK